MGDMGDLFGCPCIKGSDETEGNGTGVNSSNNVQDGVSTVQPRVEPEHEVIFNPLSQMGLEDRNSPSLQQEVPPPQANGIQSSAEPQQRNVEQDAVIDERPQNEQQNRVINEEQRSEDGAESETVHAQEQAAPALSEDPSDRVLQNQPTENSMQYNPPIQSSDSTVGLSSHGVNGQQALQDLLNNDYVVDCLAINLDIDYRLLTNWRHLAEEMEAPQDIKDKCNCNTVHSPTLTLLERPDIRNKTIQELMNAAAKRKDVLNILEEKFSEEDRNKSIEEALRCNPELMDEIATKLDQPSNRILENWKDFGKSLRIGEDELDLIENGGHNPAEKLLLYAYSSLPPAKMKAKEFGAIIMGFTKREDLHKLLVDFKITENNVRHLKYIIPPNSEYMKIMTAALNRCSPGLQNWKNLAYSWGRDAVDFDYPPKQSPTKTLLEWVCKTMDRKFTVDQFLNILGKIERYDVKQKLEEVIEKHR